MDLPLSWQALEFGATEGLGPPWSSLLWESRSFLGRISANLGETDNRPHTSRPASTILRSLG